MQTPWYQDAVFYHIYPLGLCGAPLHNRPNGSIDYRLEKLQPWLKHAQGLGVNALYLGPVFQSTTHGYDTSDYYQIDRRLGDNQSFARFAESVHQHGMRLVLDGVFNHVGRDFWAFKDVLQNGAGSAYVDWFHNLQFGQTSPMGDPFCYEGWQGHFSLVKLNLSHPHVREHLFDAVRMWIDQFAIDGLRLDAADCIDFDFLRALHSAVRGYRKDFWLMGEVVHGDYREWVNPATLDAVTNYECYKGLYSSLNDDNYFEIAYSLDRQFADQGRYADLYLYNFVDNHDVDRVASKLDNPAHLYPLYVLLFTMPGLPAVYYGSEWGFQGVKGHHSDEPLRPSLELSQMERNAPHPDLAELIRKLTHIRHASAALRRGRFQTLHVDHQQFVFLRQTMDEVLVVALNSAYQQVDLEIRLPFPAHALTDLLNPGETFPVKDGKTQASLPPSWCRILISAG
jgi:cyclomaltodextrinase / maltogenic alpha-amylase / neopullulanase